MTDILWVLVCSGLVFLMQPGFMCLESGLTRSKNSINVAVKNIADFGISVTLFWAIGYALMFGENPSGWLGISNFFINISTPSVATFFLFQTMFCSTSTTIVSGAVAERMKFISYLVVAGLVSGLIYPIFGCWAWNGLNVENTSGWLRNLGFVDFAGSTVVHSIGAWVSLATLSVVGPRSGRFRYSGHPRKIHGSNMQLAVLGTLLLWFGWLGFNGGSTLSLNDQVPGIMVNTMMAGSSGMLTGAAISWYRRKIPQVEALMNGSLAGLVAVTASCHAVTTLEAVIIGIIGAGIMMIVAQMLEDLKIDDAVDAIAVHGGAGIWGTLAVAWFGDPQILGTGLTVREQFGVQLLGIIVAGVWAFSLTYGILWSLNQLIALRVSLAEEKIGLNISEHQAQTEIHDLFQVMQEQANTQDLALRVPVEPFTEVGQIAHRYNQVMAALEEAVSKTQAVFNTASDGILTFTLDNLEISKANPSAEKIFGYPLAELMGVSIDRLISIPSDPLADRLTVIRELIKPGRHEAIGLRSNGAEFPIEATLTKANLGEHRTFYVGTFRDITRQKKTQADLAKANGEILELNQQLKEENLRMSSELDVTRKLQKILLPKVEELTAIPELTFAVFMEPAFEVGGDYYDVLLHDLGVKIAIGDVTGHGLESGVLSIMVQTAVRTLLEAEETDPERFLDILNRTIYHNVQRMKSDKSLTLSMLDYTQGQLRLSGQHEELLIVRADGRIERIDTIDLGIPLGLQEDVSEFFDSIVVDLSPGDGGVLYTDGITEAENSDGKRYGLDRLCDRITQVWHYSTEEIRDRLIADIRSYIGSHTMYDDITLVVFKRKESYPKE
ncbi:ammonium transporter [Roseofilum reptotaenium AO1-A]|uniref:Ammonium transporter n=1 Tax=Roseofilum reptotaenium AO1-A TaxID=1925591 RepID=A0A1L9QKA1_9CYAN|nr:ammonium transporter [Roseofilum reptotaenium AO1-A]